MNTYRFIFGASCPNNGDLIVYSLAITTPRMVHIEHIKTACALHDEGYHEDIAKDLHARFGGLLVLTANHHGVQIETRLGEPAAAATFGDDTQKGHHEHR